MSGFVHLHLHTQYSVLDGAIKIKDLISRAKAQNQSAVAVTDHGVMHGAVEFYQEATAADIKPILGCEIYITAGSRFERKTRAQGGASTHHLTLLCQNLTGYRNLCKLITSGFIEGFYFRPRVDFELLKELNAGLICLSGCLSSEFASFSKVDDFKKAREHVERYATVFGDRFYLEVQPHEVPEQTVLNEYGRRLGTDLGIPLVATNDAHYLDAGDHHAHEVLMCVSTGKLITDEDRMRHDGAHLHFKTSAEMAEGLPEFSDAITETLEVAKRCNVEFDFSTYHMPQFKVAAETTIEREFTTQARSDFERRLPEIKRTAKEFSEADYQAYQDRLELEIALIIEMGFAGYFLVVADFIQWAKRNDIPVGPGRGSAAGSLVAYAMYITEIDPIRHNLLFERFLNPERISLPDIDVDFCINGRDRVIQYVREKYGQDRVAQIVTFGTLKAKAAIKDVGRVLGLSYAETDRIAKLVPAPRQGFDYPISEALKMEKRLREYAEGEGKQLIELAMKLEGLSRHTSTHAAGLVIADRPVVELLPLMVDKDSQVVTQFSMGAVEKIGLVKFDFLGLKTLTVLNEAVKMIASDLGERIQLNTLPLEDPETYQLISAGQTIGVFQLESSGITDMVARLKPTCFEDIVAILALYRPGPLDAGMADHFINRKHGREEVKYPHPILQPILKDTYGIILYQEQIMQIARDMAGYSLGEADILRRAMGKKKPAEMAKQREIFVNGSTSRGVSASVATEVFNQMETFARYGFNRSHSVAYAFISFQTAYLKAHYPRHFMAALMSQEMTDADRTLKNISECRDLGIEVSPPDVNKGEIGFNVVDGKIFFGLAAIKGIGEKVVGEILDKRAAGGVFKSLGDFCLRLDSTGMNRRVLENLVKSGAFDWSSVPRAELLGRLDETLKWAQAERSEKDSRQIGLFSAMKRQDTPFVPKGESLPEWPVNIRLAHEKEALGFYLSGHPLEKFKRELQAFGSLQISQLAGSSDGAQVTAAGVVTLLRLKNTKKGDRYATFVLEDLGGTVEVIVWPDVYNKVQGILVADDPVLISGRLDVGDERITLVASSIESAIALRDRKAKEAIVLLDQTRLTPEKLERLRSVLAEHRGKIPVKLVLKNPLHSETVVALSAEIQVEPSETLCNRVEELFGQPVMTFR